MIIPQKYAAVNWADGMKVNKDHFTQTEKYFTDQLRDTLSTSTLSYNYGLLPSLPGSQTSPNDFSLTKSNPGRVTITVHQCQAITAGGARIDISNDELSETVETALVQQDEDEVKETPEIGYFYVIVSVDPFEKLPAGNPDPEEIPIRQPHTRPAYKLQLTAAEYLDPTELGAFHLIIGRIVRRGTDLSKDENYIPPSTSIGSHRLLINRYRVFTQYLNDLQSISLQIIQKINYKNQRSTVASNVQECCKRILDYCNIHYFRIRNVLHEQAPVFLIESISQLASIMYTAIQILPESEKEELLNYFFEWSDISPVQFVNILTSVIDIDYKHYAAADSLQLCDIMAQRIVTVWRKLNTLEFIGLRKENIVVKEEVLTRVTKDRKGWNILD